MNWIRTIMVLMAGCTGLPKAGAQTVTTQYQPGVTQDAAVYFLPKTAIRVAVRVEQTVYTPGDFAPYAERFLRLRDVSLEPSTSYRLVSVTQTPVGVRDTTKAYAVRFAVKTSAINLAQAEDGVLLAVNTDGERQATPPPYRPAPRQPQTDARQFLTEEILAAGSMAKMAQLTAQEIYDLRDSRSQIIKGQADFMPKDGEQLRLMLAQLDQQDQALTSLFAGTTTKDTTETVFTVVPGEEPKDRPLFRLSRHFGLVDADDMSGEPYFLQTENLTQLPAANPAAEHKKKKAENGLYYNVPGKVRSTVSTGSTVVSQEEFAAAQYGHVELLSGDLFNKHYGTRLWLNPITGGIERLKAEQPK